MQRLEYTKRGRQDGFTLIEALIALLVMSFGMLAIAGLQISLTRSSDAAKQRSEAVRLAQLKMEELRSFDGLNPGAGVTYSYAGNVVDSPPLTPNQIAEGTNTTFTRAWTVRKSDHSAATGNDLEKWINVAVSWPDRTGQTQTITLDSVVARNDPSALKTMIAGQARAKQRSPKGRSANIPYPAVSLAGGRTSAFTPPGASVSYVFDDATGNVLGHCSGTLTTGAAVTLVPNQSDADTSNDSVTAGCTAQDAYLLSGYVRFVNASSPNAGDLENSTDATSDLHSATPLVIDSSATGSGPASVACYAQRQKTMSANKLDPNNISSASRSGGVVTITLASSHSLVPGMLVAIRNVSDYTFNGSFTIVATPTSHSLTYAQPGASASASGGVAELIQQVVVAESATPPPGYNKVDATFVAYTCIVAPVDDDSNAATRPAWWGEVKLVPGAAWTIGTASNASKVCRYSSDYIATGAVLDVSNNEHPRYYRRVTESLDNQNFAVIRASAACPTDVAANPLAQPADLINTNSVSHQPTAELSFRCANASCSGSNKQTIEPALPAVVPMF